MRARYPQHYVYFLYLTRTGMREGEVLGLFCDDVQFGQDASDRYRFIHIQRTYDAVHKIFDTPKNGKTRRVGRVHDLRHSYATIQLYEMNAPIQYVSEQLGHASIKITVDTYGHPRQGTNITLADRLDIQMRADATRAQPGLTCSDALS